MKTGPELLVEISQFPTLEILLDRDPHAKPYNDEELVQLVKRERLERAMASVKDDEKRNKRKAKDD